MKPVTRHLTRSLLWALAAWLFWPTLPIVLEGSWDHVVYGLVAVACYALLVWLLFVGRLPTDGADPDREESSGS